VLAGALTYANSLTGPFVFDDRGTVLDNPTIESLWDRDVLTAPQEAPVAGRPVANVSFALNYALGQRNVAGYHVGNVALHLLCALLVFGLVRRTLQLASPDANAAVPLGRARATAGAGGRPVGAGPTPGRAEGLPFVVALIWTVHPLNSEVVNYLTQRTESLMALFYLLTLYASARLMQEPRRTAWMVVAVAACALGMASKESMITAPLMVLVYDRVFASGSFAQALRTRRGLYAGLAATWLVLAYLVAGAPRTLSAGFAAHDAAPWTYLLNQAVMVTRYLRLALWPDALTLYYGWPLPLTVAEVWPRALFIVALLALTVVALVRMPRLGFLGAWFFITLAPTSSIVPIATEVGAERRMYLPQVAVIALLVILVDRAFARSRDRGMARVIGRTAVAVVCALLAFGTVSRNREYRSSLRLAETTLERWPTPAAHSMLGMELAAVGRFAEAEPHLRIAAPVYPPARYYLAPILARNGDTSEAIAQFQSFIREQPSSLDQVHLARSLLAELYMKNELWGEAVEQYRLMVAARPADREARSLLAAALVRQQSYAAAIEEYRHLLSEQPDDVKALGGLGISLASLGRVDEAIAAFRRAVELDPGNPHARQNLQRALAMK
jgi:Flp pilus assembly protein TadD